MYIAVRALEFYCINYGVQIEAYGDLFGLRYDLFGLRYDLNHGLNLKVDPFSNVVAVGVEREQRVLCPELRPDSNAPSKIRTELHNF